jgi:ABC-2 type transport system ATP-binding protein
MLAGLIRPDAGEVLIDGIAFTGEGDPRKRRVGLVPQDLALYAEISAMDNLVFFGSLQGLSGSLLARRCLESLEIVGLTPRAGDRVKTFSGGMKRRLNLAAALVHEPELLLLDEPTVGVDPQSRNAIFDNIEALRRAGKTILYTTHYMEEVERLCDRVVIMDHGRVIADDTVSGLRQRAAAAGRMAMELADAGDGAWLETLRSVAGVVTVVLTGNTLSLEVTEVDRGAVAVLECLADRGLRVTGFSTHQPRLEDVFLQLTGRSLRDG